MRRSAWILAASLALAAVGWWLARPTAPDAFYEPPAGAMPGPPGTLLRQATFGRGVPPGAQGWRILYTTTRADGAPTVASAVVLVSSAPHAGPRPVIAWTHGTTGVAPGCAPSLLDDPFAHVPALRQLIDSGWTYVATDYVGLGTRGPHPYLIGEGEARSALDSIRAARSIDGVRTSDAVVVWGHSQGGHAALWTGILAPSYAPDVEVLGVAALAPASDLRALIEAVHRTPVGRIISSFVLRSYSETYPDVSFSCCRRCNPHSCRHAAAPGRRWNTVPMRVATTSRSWHRIHRSRRTSCGGRGTASTARRGRRPAAVRPVRRTWSRR